MSRMPTASHPRELIPAGLLLHSAAALILRTSGKRAEIQDCCCWCEILSRHCKEGRAQQILFGEIVVRV